MSLLTHGSCGVTAPALTGTVAAPWGATPATTCWHKVQLAPHGPRCCRHGPWRVSAPGECQPLASVSPWPVPAARLLGVPSIPAARTRSPGSTGATNWTSRLISCQVINYAATPRLQFSIDATRSCRRYTRSWNAGHGSEKNVENFESECKVLIHCEQGHGPGGTGSSCSARFVLPRGFFPLRVGLQGRQMLV